MPSDPERVGDDDLRFVHPFEARKRYRCPGCTHDIPPGLGHMVVVPVDEPDLRRHWHKVCWEQRARCRPGRA